MNDALVDPFNEGHWAREDNINRTANPYPKGCRHYNEWERGWENADDLISKQERPLDPKLHAAPEPRPKRDDT